MFSPVEFLLLLAAIALLGFAWVSLKTRELANRIAREYCRKAEVQLLDGSVGFGTFGVVRESGKLKLRRVYVFDYTEHNVVRRHAAIEFVGGHFRNLLLLDN